MPSTDTLPRPPVAEDEPPGLHLSATQVVASALAAVTATLAASYLGVAGTLIGAAVASVVTVVGNALYAHSITRTRDRVQGTLHLASRPSAAVSAPTTAAARPSPLRRIGGWRLAAAAGVVFVVLLAIMGTVGLVAGRSVTSIVRNEPVHSASTVSPHSTPPPSSAAPSSTAPTSVEPTTASPSETSAPSSNASTDATSPAATQSAAPSGSAVQTQSASP